MNAYDCLFKKDTKVDDVAELVANILEVEKQDVAQFLESSDCNIYYEDSVLNDNAEFSWMLTVYVNDEEKIRAQKLYNPLLFGLTVSRCLDTEVLINAHCVDPYLWILVEQGKIYLVDEIDEDNDGVNLHKHIKQELSLAKVLASFPDEKHFDKHKTISHTAPLFPMEVWTSWKIK